MMDGTQLWKNWFAIRPGFLLAFFLFCLQGLRGLLERPIIWDVFVLSVNFSFLLPSLANGS